MAKTPCPSPEFGCFSLRRRWRNRKAKKDQKKGVKLASADASADTNVSAKADVSTDAGLGAGVPSAEEVSMPVRPSVTDMYRALLQEQVDPPDYLQNANLSISYGARVHRAGISYQLTDHERLPSRIYGRPGRKVEMETPSYFGQIVQMKMTLERCDAVNQIQLIKDPRHRALEMRLMRAYEIQKHWSQFKSLGLMDEMTEKNRPALPASIDDDLPCAIYKPLQHHLECIQEGDNREEHWGPILEYLKAEQNMDKHAKAEWNLRIAKKHREGIFESVKKHREKVLKKHLELQKLIEEAKPQTIDESSTVPVAQLRKTSGGVDTSQAHQEAAQSSREDRTWRHVVKSGKDKKAGGDAPHVDF